MYDLRLLALCGPKNLTSKLSAATVHCTPSFALECLISLHCSFLLSWCATDMNVEPQPLLRAEKVRGGMLHPLPITAIYWPSDSAHFLTSAALVSLVSLWPDSSAPGDGVRRQSLEFRTKSGLASQSKFRRPGNFSDFEVVYNRPLEWFKNTHFTEDKWVHITYGTYGTDGLMVSYDFFKSFQLKSTTVFWDCGGTDPLGSFASVLAMT